MKRKNIVLLILCTLLTANLYAQKLSLGYLYPAGGEVGTTVEIEAGGLNINKATKVMFSHPGIRGELHPFVEEAAAKKKRKRLNDQSSPQLADKIKIEIKISGDVPCGLYDLRLQGPAGVSNMLPFEVASYPNLLENSKSTLKKPNIVESLPAVLCGWVTPGGVDYFKFSGCKGDSIVASVKARALVPYIADAVPGWFQPVLKLMDSRGREVAYSDDNYHNVDPLIITTLPKDGDYTLMIHDAIYRGRQDFTYRIQVGQIPYVTGRYPAYGVAGKKVKQELEGVNLGTSKEVIKVKKAGYNHLTYTNKVGTSNAVPFYALPKKTKLVHSPKEATMINVATAIADSLTSTSKIKRYRIYLEEKKPVFVELIGRRNGSRIDGVMRLINRFGKVVAEVDDTEDPTQGLMTFHADPILKYISKRSDEYILEVEDRHQGYGKDYHYLLVRHRQMPPFNAFASPANITIPAGGTSWFRVDIEGKIKRPAQLVIKGLPRGYTTSSLQIQSGKRWDVSITAPKSAELERFPIEVKLDYPGAEGREHTDVLPADNMMQAFYYTHHIPAAELAIDLAEPSPYRMSLGFDIDEELLFTFKDETIPVKILIDKDPGFNDPVELILGKKNGLFSLEPVSIMPEEKEKTIYIKLNDTALQKLKNKKSSPVWQMNIIGTVKGEIVRQGKRTFQNAKYREMTPFFLIKLNR